MPVEVILVDGGNETQWETRDVVERINKDLPFQLIYLRQQGGTAIQRNYGIDRANGDFIAFIDDDVRVEPDFFEQIIKVFEADIDRKVGGIVGYRTNKYITFENNKRWHLYRRLHLLSTYEPGRYDAKCGYPINASLQPPFTGTREVDYMTTACAVWRKEVFDDGLRFDLFFAGYGMLEDAHFSLLAGKKWKLLQCGDAHCIELHAGGGREPSSRIGFKMVVNYFYVFSTTAGPLSGQQKWRFFRYQFFELFRIFTNLVQKREKGYLNELLGRMNGIFYCMTTPLSSFNKK